jgi:hypothetical protein
VATPVAFPPGRARQFGARVQEQRDKLAKLAKTLGVKAAQ